MPQPASHSEPDNTPLRRPDHPVHVTLIRHTETDWNTAKRYQSHSDRPLTDKGEQQLNDVHQSLAESHFDFILSTGLQRTDRLADLLQRTNPRGEKATSLLWRECDHGTWEGKTYDEVKETFPDQSEARFDQLWSFKEHQGESLQEVTSRIQQAWDGLMTSSHKRIAVITHATPIQLIHCMIHERPPENYWRFQVDHGSVTRLDARPDGIRLEGTIDTPK